jgi:ABC-2 type transport system permease protein
MRVSQPTSIRTRLDITLALWAACIRGAAQYRANFLIMVAMGLIYQGVGFAFIWVVLSRFQQVGGWTLGEIAFLYGLRLVAHAFSVLAAGNIRGMDYLIRRGEFDRLLVRPLPPLLQLIGNDVQVNAFGDLLGGIIMFGAATTLVQVEWSIATIIYTVLAIGGAALLEMGLNLIVGTLAFRFLNTDSLLYLFDTFFSDFGNYPLHIFGSTIQFLLTFALPLAFVAYFPTSVVLGRTEDIGVPLIVAIAAPLAGLAWWLVAVWFFRRETARYQSAGH